MPAIPGLTGQSDDDAMILSPFHQRSLEVVVFTVGAVSDWLFMGSLGPIILLNEALFRCSGVLLSFTSRPLFPFKSFWMVALSMTPRDSLESIRVINRFGY